VDDADRTIALVLEDLSSAETAWTQFLSCYSETIFAVVRMFAQNADQSGDCFLFVCEKLAANGGGSDEGCRRRRTTTHENEDEDDYDHADDNLIDTNVVSEMRKPKPHSAALAWLKVLTLGRIHATGRLSCTDDTELAAKGRRSSRVS